MKITVTKEDIKRGIRQSPFSCPIALALERKRVNVDAVKEGAVFLHEWEDPEPGCESGDQVKISLPLKAKNFIGDFDNGYPVKPFTFNLNL